MISGKHTVCLNNLVSLSPLFYSAQLRLTRQHFVKRFQHCLCPCVLEREIPPLYLTFTLLSTSPSPSSPPLFPLSTSPSPSSPPHLLFLSTSPPLPLHLCSHHDYQFTSVPLPPTPLPGKRDPVYHLGSLPLKYHNSHWRKQQPCTMAEGGTVNV